MPNPPRCATCRWWDPRGFAEGYGYCRRNPPERQGESDDVGAWPYTEAQGWCGEHELVPPANPVVMPNVHHVSLDEVPLRHET